MRHTRLCSKQAEKHQAELKHGPRMDLKTSTSSVSALLWADLFPRLVNSLEPFTQHWQPYQPLVLDVFWPYKLINIAGENGLEREGARETEREKDQLAAQTKLGRDPKKKKKIQLDAGSRRRPHIISLYGSKQIQLSYFSTPAFCGRRKPLRKRKKSTSIYIRGNMTRYEHMSASDFD